MESNLRPLTLGEILDRTAQLYRANFLLFAGIFAVYAGGVLVLNLLQLGLQEMLKAQHMTGALIWETLATSILGLLLIFLFAGAAVAAISRAVAWVHLGEPATIRGAYQSILPRLGRYLWQMTITAFRVWTPIALLYAGVLGIIAYFGAFKGTTAQHAAAVNPQAAVVLGVAMVAFFLLIIPAGIYAILMSLRYSLAVPACVVEDLKARKAIRRSIELAKGAWGRIFLLALLVGVIKLAVVGVTQAFVLIAAVKNQGHISPGISAISQVIGFFTNAFLGPIWAAGITLFYYDQRVRKEGYDIEWMMQAAGLTPPEQKSEPVVALPDASLEPQPAAAEPTAPTEAEEGQA